MIAPFKGKKFKITSIYGYRTMSGIREFHKGLDMVGLDNINVIAVKDGTVVRSRIVTDKNNATWQWGNYVAVAHKDGTTAYYCHLKSRNVSQGQQIKAGTVIGVMGSTGYSTGPHLHFELRKGTTAINPCVLLGITNQVGTYIVPDDKDDFEVKKKKVIEKLGIETKTVMYIEGYKFAKDFWLKLYDNMF